MSPARVRILLARECDACKPSLAVAACQAPMATSASLPEPTQAELDAAAAVLRRLKPADVEQPRCAELRAAGLACFTRACTKEAFRGKDVIEFLAEQTRQKQTLRELKRLQSLIRGEHRRERIDANECGLNSARKATLEQIKQECATLRLEEQRVIDVSVAPTVSLLMRVAVPSSAVQVQLSVGGGTPGDNTTGVTDLQGRHIDDVPTDVLPPAGDFRRICNVCRGDCTHQPRHAFYHQLCLNCAEHNLKKRNQSADLHHAVALVTGGRVRIGYATVLKLLRAGALVLTTTRFPADAALRYSREHDFDEWRDRLLVVRAPTGEPSQPLPRPRPPL